MTTTSRTERQRVSSQRRRTYKIPESVRAGQRGYNQAQRDGRDPTDEQRRAHAEYEKARWAQLPQAEKAMATAASNAARVRRERLYGRNPTTPRQLAVVQLIRKHPREFERLLHEQEAKAFKELAASSDHTDGSTSRTST